MQMYTIVSCPQFGVVVVAPLHLWYLLDRELAIFRVMPVISSIACLSSSVIGLRRQMDQSIQLSSRDGELQTWLMFSSRCAL